MPDICSLIPVATACVASRVAGAVTGTAGNTLLEAIGDNFARAARSVMDGVFTALGTASRIDLSAGYVTDTTTALASIALVVIVGLFVLQVTLAAVRREPRGLSRALLGAGAAVFGTAAATAVTATLLVAVDAICDGVASLAGTSMEDAARRLLDVAALGQLNTSSGGAVLMIIFGLLFIIGAVLTLGTLLVRQALIVVAVVVAPLALAGGTSSLTSAWVRRWVQVTLALILSKLAIVVVFVVAIGMVGQATGIGALLSGLILLFLACLAPWACVKLLDFAGASIASDVHRGVTAPTLAAAAQGRAGVQSVIRTVAPIVGAAGGPGTAAGAAVAARGTARVVPIRQTPSTLPAPTTRRPDGTPSDHGDTA